MLTEDFIVFLPKPGDALSQGSLEVAKFAHRKGMRLVKRGYAISFEHPSPQRGFENRRLLLLHALPGSVRSALADDLDCLPDDMEAWVAWATERLQFFNFIQADSGTFRLLSDVIGCLRYFQAEICGGLAVSSSLRLLFSCFPELIRPLDQLALLEMLAGENPCSVRTLHQRVQRSSTGAVIEWDPRQGVRFDRRRRFQVSEIDPRQGATRENRERMHQVLIKQLNRGIADPSKVMLPLTGGLDSRLLACAAKAQGYDFETVTLALPQHREARVAAAVARTLGLKHRLAIPRRPVISRLDLWTNVLEAQCTTGTLFMAEMLDQGFPAGTTAVQGLLNDLLAGGGYQDSFDLEEPSREDVVRRILKKYYPDPSPGLLQLLGIDWSKEAYLEEIRRELNDAPEPIQSFQMFNIENKQRRLGSIPLLLGQEYHVCIPAYSPENIHNWMRVSRERKHEKRTLLQLLREIYPQVAKIPRAEDPPHFAFGSWEAFQYSIWLQVQRVRFALLRRILPGGRRKPDPTIVWRLWHDTTESQLALEIAAIFEHREVVGEVFDWELPVSEEIRPWEAPGSDPERTDRRRRACYLLIVYCQWLQEIIREASPDNSRVFVAKGRKRRADKALRPRTTQS